MGNVRYSQNDEEDVILKFFDGKIGRFLDIGAYDGVTLSNTYALRLLGWAGTYIEPDQKNFEKLVAINKDCSCENNQVAIGPTNDHLPFYYTPGDFYGSLTEGNGEKYGVKSEPSYVRCWTVERLFKIVHYDFDFISLDVEQNNLDILKEFPFDKLDKLKLICIESDGKVVEITKLMSDKGFIEIHRTPENMIFKRLE